MAVLNLTTAETAAPVTPPVIDRMQQLFAAQQRAFSLQPYPSAQSRRTMLRALKQQLQRYQDVLATAMAGDFGARSTTESKLLDVLGCVLELNHAHRHVRRWMRPSRRRTEWLFQSNQLMVRYQPKGVVGVIVPWNFPLYLAVGPVAAALAAGNRVMVKMPEATPRTNAVLKALLGEIFPLDQVAVIGEELPDPNAFTALPFNHLIFTGSPAVGRVVMQTAARNLTPVTLELGGKSPALLTRNYPVHDAAKRISHSKCVNAGQVCVAPDYALVPREHLAAFVTAAKAEFQRRYPGPLASNPDYTALIHDRHHQRMCELLADARAKGAQIEVCGTSADNAADEGASDGAMARKMPLHIVTGLTEDMVILREELFCPILPVQPYDELDEALAFINRRPRPLALYCFSHDAAERNEILQRTHSGGVTLNDCAWHAFNHDAPFGGIGNSGMGSYHGVEGFRELSHARTVFKRHRFFPIGLFYPPYGSWLQRAVMRLMLGKPAAGMSRLTR